MSWDVLVLNAPQDVGSTDDLDDETEFPPLGPAAELRARLQAELPELNLSDPTWGELGGDGWSIELNLGRDDPIHSFMLHVRGSGDDALPMINRIAAVTGGRALDFSTGDFLRGGPSDVTGWHEFQQFRDRVVSSFEQERQD